MVTNCLHERDRLYAELNLADELALYDAIAARIALPAQRADLVIVLHAPPALLHERIARRGAPGETGLDLPYHGAPVRRLRSCAIATTRHRS